MDASPAQLRIVLGLVAGALAAVVVAVVAMVRSGRAVHLPGVDAPRRTRRRDD